MRSRSLALSVLFAALLPIGLIGTSVASADPSADLAAAQESESTASSQVAAAEGAIQGAEETLAPIEAKAGKADDAELTALAHANSIEEELVEERAAAAKEIEAVEADYDNEKSTHSTVQGIGIGLAVLAVVVAGAAFALSRFRPWPLSKRLTQVAAGITSLVFVAGLVLAALPGPDAPHLSREVRELAADAEGDPADPPTQELVAAEAAVKPLAAKAKPLDAEREEAEGRLSAAESDLADTEAELRAAKQEASQAQEEIEREERIAAKESEFKEEATTIDYNELIKNPYKFIGEKVVYTGQIFQIQEEFGSAVILLSVTDEGYGFWTDEIWVDAPEVDAVEEDVITVYGTVAGGEEYETQIGGSNFVPKVKAKYIEE